MKGKKAFDLEEGWKIQETYKDLPHGWIQWKGTDVCMDVFCKCGHSFHIDSDFTYNIECPKCKTIYMCNGHIELIELETRPEMVIESELIED
jgi:hypothetical protein